jgi:hypothetical protein
MQHLKMIHTKLNFLRWGFLAWRVTSYDFDHIAENDMGGTCSTHGGKFKGKVLLRRVSLTLENHIKMDFKTIIYENVDRIQMTHQRIQ